MTEQAIIPCPFCGSECRCLRIDRVVYKYVIRCTHCTYSSGRYHTEAEAIAAHNRVAEMPERIAELEAELAKLRQPKYPRYFTFDGAEWAAIRLDTATSVTLLRSDREHHSTYWNERDLERDVATGNNNRRELTEAEAMAILGKTPATAPAPRFTVGQRVRIYGASIGGFRYNEAGTVTRTDGRGVYPIGAKPDSEPAEYWFELSSVHPIDEADVATAPAESAPPDKSDRWWSVFNAALTGIIANPDTNGSVNDCVNVAGKYANLGLARLRDRSSSKT
jgi:hypothetical protein